MPKKSVFMVLVIGLALSVTVVAQEIDSSAVTRVGQRAPDFKVKTIEGKSVQLQTLEGKAVWINFFATWCGPCKAELPALENFWQNIKTNENAVILCIGREETQEKIKPFRDERQLTLPMAPDPDRSIYGLYATKYIPRNILIDKKGMIVYQSKGYTEDEFREITHKFKALIQSE